ncbi:MAG: flagellar basal-body rod protein [Frankiales bacterium]|nr:flagellar basal-body rod protein [Frankiales bacterium]
MLDDLTTSTIATALSGLAMRQRVSANNIANIETPNFHAGRVDFETSLRDAVSSGDPADSNISQTTTTDMASANGNNVNLDQETVIDQQTLMQYQLLTGAITSKFSLLDTVIKG